MSPRTFVILYLIVAIFALVVTVQRVVAGNYLSALLTGAIAAYAFYRTYTVSRMSR
jgi:uncharacterized membrane protein